MTFGQSITTVLTKYADFTGRARRSEYWWFSLFGLIVEFVLALIDPVLYIVALLGLIVPSLAVGVRRLHDTGRSGWSLLVALIPLVGGIILVVFMATPGNPGRNQYGNPV